MKMIPPIEVTAAKLTATNVAITETEWTAGTYATGVQRYVGTDLYEVVADPNTTDEPTAGAAALPPTWIKLGKVNRFRMFDSIIGDVTTQDGSTIDVTVTPGEVVNAVALFETVANTVQVIVDDPTEGEVYNETMSMNDDTGIGDWYSYFFEPINRRTDAVFTDLPNYSAATVQVIIVNSAGDAVCGELFVGRQVTIGATLLNTETGIEDFSRKERDQFGRFVIVERRFAKTANFDIYLTNAQVNLAKKKLEERRAKATVYIGDETKAETIIVGFYRDFNALRTGPLSTEMTLEIEGLI